MTLGAVLFSLPTDAVARLIASVSTSKAWIEYARASGCAVGRNAWVRAKAWIAANPVTSLLERSVNLGGKPSLLKKAEVAETLMRVLENCSRETSRFQVKERAREGTDRVLIAVRILTSSKTAAWRRCSGIVSHILTVLCFTCPAHRAWPQIGRFVRYLRGLSPTSLPGGEACAAGGRAASDPREGVCFVLRGLRCAKCNDLS